MILRNTNRLMQLINKLLDLSKLESAKKRLLDLNPNIKGLKANDKTTHYGYRHW